MAIRKINFAPGEYYHIYGRGVAKQRLFLDERDWIRFLFLILSFQSSTSFNNLVRYVERYVKGNAFNMGGEKMADILRNRSVELVCFALMPNHFHLVVKELNERGISEYMQRVLTAYAMYFKSKYNHAGHVFQGPFGATHIANNEQLLHVSAYVHRNPRELKRWYNKEHAYPWSSFQDYVGENRWEKLLVSDIVLGQFSDGKTYRKFVDTSGVKENVIEAPAY